MPVALSQASGFPVTVAYTTEAYTALAGSDFVATSGTVQMPAGTTSATIPVTILADGILEPHERFFVRLSTPTNATMQDGEGLATIQDDDPDDGPPSSGPGDVNGDGWPDLVWRHLGSGYNAFWLMTGTQQTLTALFQPSGAELLADQNWEIRAVGDMNGDHKPDVVWQEKTVGYLAVWLFDGVVRTGTPWFTTLSGSSIEPDLNWKIVGAADMDRDGHVDLIWRNQTTGANRIWHMTGLTQRDSFPLTLSSTDPLWQIVGVADMNSDQWPDLIWRHYGTGGLASWLMNDTTVQATLWLTPDVVADTTWRIVGVADLDRNGKNDLVWQCVATGELAVWYMNDLALVSTNYLNPRFVTDTQWRIVGVK